MLYEAGVVSETSAIHSVTTHVRIEFRAFFLVSCNFQGVSLYKFLRRLSQGVLELILGALLCFFLGYLRIQVFKPHHPTISICTSPNKPCSKSYFGHKGKGGLEICL